MTGSSMVGGGWRPMQTAPRDGRAIIVAVRGRDEKGTGNVHELPYPVRYIGGRWCYARNNAPVFWWHEPKHWRERRQ